MPKQAQPVISVVIPTRNYGRYLPRALESVFRCHNPTDAPIQVVVTDDGSRDDTSAVLAHYRRRYPENLVAISLRARVGLGHARNVALDQCRGRIIALLDADDEFLPDKLTHSCAALRGGGVDLVTNDFYHQSDEGGRVLQNRQTWRTWFWPPSTWVFWNGVVRFNSHFAAAEDVEWMSRHWWSLRRCHLDRPLNVQYLHPRQLCKRWESRTPGDQLGNWMIGWPHPADALVPPAWACRECGNQYLLPTRCCDRENIRRPLLFYVPALSPYCRTKIEFSVVLLTRNGLALTRRAITSLLAPLSPAQRQALELIVVDGGSTDGTLEYLRDLAAAGPLKLILTHPDEPFNYARACNRGAMAAVGEYLLLVNNDIEVQGEAPWPALRAALAEPRVGVAGAATVRGIAGPEPAWPADGARCRRVSRPLTGEFWGMRRELYWELGGMDEAFTGYGCDELEFQYRAQLAHYELAQVRVRVAHAARATYGARYSGAALRAMEGANWAAFARKHGRAIEHRGAALEPFSSRASPERTVVIAVQDEAGGLRASLAAAAADAGCRAGRVQVVVVDNGSADETALVLGEYRERLAGCLTVVRLAEPVGRAQALRLGRARAASPAVRVLLPGSWQVAAGDEPGPPAPSAAPLASEGRGS